MMGKSLIILMLLCNFRVTRKNLCVLRVSELVEDEGVDYPEVAEVARKVANLLHASQLTLLLKRKKQS